MLFELLIEKTRLNASNTTFYAVPDGAVRFLFWVFNNALQIWIHFQKVVRKT